jgi:hypothetical protein
MSRVCLTALLTWIVLFAACALPQWRVLQKKVDPTLAQKPAAQVEAERQGARFIVQKSASVGPSPVAQLADIHAVAVPLAASLGEPAKPVTLADQAAVIAALERGLRAEQKKAEQWRSFALRYANRPIEGTGINLAGPAGVLALVGVIAACVFCPTFLWLVLRIVPVLLGALRSAAGGIEALAAKAPEAVEQVKKNVLAPQMSPAKRTAVRMAKRGVVRGILTKATA